LGLNVLFPQTLRLSAHDTAALEALSRQLRRWQPLLRMMLQNPMPSLVSAKWSERWHLLKLAMRLRVSGKTSTQEFLRVVGSNVWDWLSDHLESDALKAGIAYAATLGNSQGPRAPGTVFNLLYQQALSQAPSPAGRWRFIFQAPPPERTRLTVRALTHYLHARALQLGVLIDTDSPVRRIDVDEGKVVGVTLDCGETIAAEVVIAACDVKTALLTLVGPAHLDTDLVRRLTRFRSLGTTAKLQLALKNTLPPFAHGGAVGSGRYVVAESLVQLERAFDAIKYGEIPSEPCFEFTVPSVLDRSVVSHANAHVLSVIIHPVCFRPKAGWEHAGPQLIERVLNALERLIPGLRGEVSAQALLSPVDLETRCRVSGGHWHHGELILDQALFARPVYGLTQHLTPIGGLILASASNHPGGGVHGLAGLNAAKLVHQRAPAALRLSPEGA